MNQHLQSTNAVVASVLERLAAAATLEPVQLLDGVVEAIENTYAESATPDQLMEKYGLTAPFIVKAVKAVLKRKNHRG